MNKQLNVRSKTVPIPPDPRRHGAPPALAAALTLAAVLLAGLAGTARG